MHPHIRLSTRSILTYSPCALADTGKFKRLPADAWDFLSSLDDCDATHAVTATVDGEVVGWFRCSVFAMTASEHRKRGMSGLYAQGTWVDSRHRRLGLGKRLWLHVLTCLDTRHVIVDTVTRNGAELVRSLKRELPALSFEHNS